MDTDESLPSESENATRLAMTRPAEEGEGLVGWLPEPEWRPAWLAGGTGAVAAAGVGRLGGRSLALSLSSSPELFLNSFRSDSY
jgi:hypothetical protein